MDSGKCICVPSPIGYLIFGEARSDVGDTDVKSGEVEVIDEFSVTVSPIWGFWFSWHMIDMR
jgi:hypothetical protein